jgi:hypothetical protein
VYGDAWVSGNTRVYGDAQVSGNTRVSGNAWVYGDAWEQSPLQIQGSMHFFNECKKGFLKIGCIESSFEEWKLNFAKKGEENRYSEVQIKEYELYINLAIELSKLNNQQWK